LLRRVTPPDQRLFCRDFISLSKTNIRSSESTRKVTAVFFNRLPDARAQYCGSHHHLRGEGQLRIDCAPMKLRLCAIRRIWPHAIMRNILWILSITVLLVGCQKQQPSVTTGSTNMTSEQFAELFNEEKNKADAWFAALDAAKPSASLVAEFLRLFPNAVANYKYFTSTGEPGFDVGVDLHERYDFRMQLPVRFDPEGSAVIGYGEPMFYLLEVASQNGGATSYNPAGERQFGSADWRKIVQNGGDFSVIGYTMLTNRPIPGFTQRNVQP